MAMARKGSIIKSNLGMLLYGKPFTGKSTLAMQLTYFKRPDGKPFRVLYLDPESGSIDDYIPELEANGVNLDNLYIVYTQSLGEVRQYIAKVKNHEDFYELDENGIETEKVVADSDGEPFRADAIVVDGTSILNLTTKQGLIEFSKKRNKVKADNAGLVGDARLVKIEGAGLEWKDYSTVNFKGQDLILDLMAAGVSYIVTAREKEETKTVQNGDGTTSNIGLGIFSPDSFKGIEHNVKTEIRMFRNEDGVVCANVLKDRTHVHEDNVIIEDPTLLDWQTVIDRSAGKSNFVIKNDLTKAVEVEQNIYAKEVLGQVGKPSKEIDIDNEPKNVTETADSLRSKIIAKRNALQPAEKMAMKKKLEAEGLPTAYKNVTDIEILKQVLNVFD